MRGTKRPAIKELAPLIHQAMKVLCAIPCILLANGPQAFCCAAVLSDPRSTCSRLGFLSRSLQDACSIHPLPCHWYSVTIVQKQAVIIPEIICLFPVFPSCLLPFYWQRLQVYASFVQNSGRPAVSRAGPTVTIFRYSAIPTDCGAWRRLISPPLAYQSSTHHSSTIIIDICS
jgi:hypothetical protein